MLAFFFYSNQSRCTPDQIKQLKKWFWHTCCGERYSGSGFNRNIPSDIKFFKRLSKKIGAKYRIEEKVNPIDFLRTNYKSTNKSTAASAYYNLLRLKKPLYLLNGKEMLLDNTSSISNRKDRHHIYPYSLLKSHGINKWVSSIANICYIAADDNESVQNYHPGKYLQDYKRLKHFSRTMKSYLIPYRSDSPIWTRNVKKGFLNFINLRGMLILNTIEKTAGLKKWQLFDKFDPLRRIS